MEVTILQFAERIKALTASSSPIVFKPLPEDDPLRRCPDIAALAQRLLEWAPTVPLADGLTRTINYFQELEQTRTVKNRNRR